MKDGFEAVWALCGMVMALYAIFFTKRIRASGAQAMRAAGHEWSARLQGSWLYGLFIKAFGVILLAGFSIIFLMKVEALLIYFHLLPADK